MKKYVVFFITSLVVIFGCTRRISARKRYLPNHKLSHYPIRLDGYYYYISHGYHSPIATRHFLFDNGKILDAFSCDLDSLSAKEVSEFTTDYFKASLSDSTNMFYTNFLVKNDSISYERIFPSQGYPHELYGGRILNDTTFLITSIQTLPRGTTDKLNDLYHFKQFTIPKWK